ncbi:MAG: tripartite tricarboxylate transporter TctB family protein [Thermodesulfobacteriota bacterium]
MKKDIFLGSALVAMSVILFVELQKTKNPAIMADQVSAATFPSLLVGVLLLLGVLLVVTACLKKNKQKGQEGQARPAPFNWGKLRYTYQVPMLMFVFLCFYIFLTPVIGFYTMTFLFFVSTGILLGGPARKNIAMVVPAALASIIFVYYVFQVYMRVIMPDGLLY